MTAESTAVCESADRRGRRPAFSGSAAYGARLREGRCPPESWQLTMRGTRRPPRTVPAAPQMRAAPNPRTLTGWSGASPSRPPVPLWALLRFPVCPPGSSPSSAVLWFPFVRRSPVRSLRPFARFRFRSVSLRVPYPLSNLHVSAAARRFRKRWSPAAGTKVTSSAATTVTGCFTRRRRRPVPARGHRSAARRRRAILRSPGCGPDVTDIEGRRPSAGAEDVVVFACRDAADRERRGCQPGRYAPVFGRRGRCRGLQRLLPSRAVPRLSGLPVALVNEDSGGTVQVSRQPVAISRR